VIDAFPLSDAEARRRALADRLEKLAMWPRETPDFCGQVFEPEPENSQHNVPHCIRCQIPEYDHAALEAAAALRLPRVEPSTLSHTLELDGPEPAPIRVAGFLRHYAGMIRKKERWDIPETIASAYESAALALENYVQASPPPWEPGVRRAPAPEATQAYEYLRRLFLHKAPQCEALPDLLGLCTQIDNLIAGLKQAPSPSAPSIVGERWVDVDVGHGVLYGRCPRCGCARIGEYCPPPCNTVSARWARGQRVCVPERQTESIAGAASTPGAGAV
jgi:hypothetical protein